jgi:hypothetical protein
MVTSKEAEAITLQAAELDNVDVPTTAPLFADKADVVEEELDAMILAQTASLRELPSSRPVATRFHPGDAVIAKQLVAQENGCAHNSASSASSASSTSSSASSTPDVDMDGFGDEDSDDDMSQTTQAYARRRTLSQQLEEDEGDEGDSRNDEHIIVGIPQPAHAGVLPHNTDHHPAAIEGSGPSGRCTSTDTHPASWEVLVPPKRSPHPAALGNHPDRPSSLGDHPASTPLPGYRLQPVNQGWIDTFRKQEDINSRENSPLYYRKPFGPAVRTPNPLIRHLPALPLERSVDHTKHSHHSLSTPQFRTDVLVQDKEVAVPSVFTSWEFMTKKGGPEPRTPITPNVVLTVPRGQLQAAENGGWADITSMTVAQLKQELRLRFGQPPMTGKPKKQEIVDDLTRLRATEDKSVAGRAAKRANRAQRETAVVCFIATGPKALLHGNAQCLCAKVESVGGGHVDVVMPLEFIPVRLNDIESADVLGLVRWTKFGVGAIGKALPDEHAFVRRLVDLQGSNKDAAADMAMASGASVPLPPPVGSERVVAAQTALLSKELRSADAKIAKLQHDNATMSSELTVSRLLGKTALTETHRLKAAAEHHTKLLDKARSAPTRITLTSEQLKSVRAEAAAGAQAGVQAAKGAAGLGLGPSKAGKRKRGAAQVIVIDDDNENEQDRSEDQEELLTKFAKHVAKADDLHAAERRHQQNLSHDVTMGVISAWQVAQGTHSPAVAGVAVVGVAPALVAVQSTAVEVMAGRGVDLDLMVSEGTAEENQAQLEQLSFNDKMKVRKALRLLGAKL